MMTPQILMVFMLQELESLLRFERHRLACIFQHDGLHIFPRVGGAEMSEIFYNSMAYHIPKIFVLIHII